MTPDTHDDSLSSIFEGVVHVYTISDEAFNKLKALCKTSEGIAQFLGRDPGQVMNTILALCSRKNKVYKALAVRILNADEAMFRLTNDFQAARVMTLLERDAFTADQKTQILSAKMAVYGLADKGQAARLMTLLEGDTLNPEQKTQILKTNRAVEWLAYKGQAERVMTLLEGDTFTPAQITQILNVDFALATLADEGQAERVQALRQKLRSDQAENNGSPPSSPPPGLEP